MEKKIIITALICSLCSLIAVLFIFIYICSSQNKKIHSYEEYYNKTELLLDNIANDNDFFLDVTCETDTYIEYLKARNKLK